MKYYYVTQTKIISVKGSVNEKTTSLVGYNMNKMECDNLFYEFKRDSDGHKCSSKIVHYGDKTITTLNSYGGHETRFKSDNEAYRKLIAIPREFNKALSVINKYGFTVIPKGIVTGKYQVKSYQQAVDL